jgi:CheY-like chemotaxis protein
MPQLETPIIRPDLRQGIRDEKCRTVCRICDRQTAGLLGKFAIIQHVQGSHMPSLAGHLLRVPPPPPVRIAGRTILVVEDEPLIMLDIAQAIEAAGASVLQAMNIQAAMRHAEEAELAGAVLDWIGTGLCRRLTERAVPYVFYSGRPASDFADWQAPVVGKPARPEMIIAALEQLVSNASGT